jgi:hypothetical protein
MLIMAALAWKGRRRHKAVPLLPRLRRAIGISFGGLLWHTSVPYDYRMERRAPDVPKDYVRDLEEKLDEKGRNRSQE